MESDIYVKEGKVVIAIPNPVSYVRKDKVVEYTWSPVFYNPVMTFNRDMSVLVLYTFLRLNGLHGLVVDALSGSGIRAIRYCVEVNNNIECIANDIDRASYNYIIRNIRLNRVEDRVRATNLDANELMYNLLSRGSRPIFIDIDPFGSPVPFIKSSIMCVRNGGLLGITATDTAPLSGVKYLAGSRRYDVRLRKNDIGDEVGIRVLLSYIARRAAEEDRYIVPLLSYRCKHYYRVFVKVYEGV